jgi:hypothetical protein
VTVAQYRAFLNSFGRADIPSLAAFRERALTKGLDAEGVKADTAQAKHLDAPRVFLLRDRN